MGLEVGDPMPGPRRSKQLITAARRELKSAASLDEAVARLARILRTDFPGVVRVSVRVLLPDGDVQIAGLWTEGPTRIPKGLIVRPLATSLPELRRGQAIVQRLNSRNPPLEDVLKEEGVWSFLSMPLRARGELVAILSISSTTIDEFDPSDATFFTQFGGALEWRLIELIDEAR